MIILGDLQLGHKDLDTWKPGPNSAGGVSVQTVSYTHLTLPTN